MTSSPSSPRADGPLRTLLAGVLDYAGLFPPAGEGMAAALRAYDAYRRGEHAWMLGSFVAPAARLGELHAVLEALGSDRGALPLSALVASAEEGARLEQELGGLPAGCIALAALEVAPLAAAAIGEGHGGMPGRVPVFYEVPLDGGMEARLDAIASVGARAKVRTGGVRADAFPTAAALAAFVVACAERDVPFKATAGLHHPFRGLYPLTYAAGSDEGTMFGFLELGLVAALVRAGAIGRHEAAGLLRGDGGPVAVAAEGIRWAGASLGGSELERLRRDFFVSFGSCSFAEPVAELAEAGLLTPLAVRTA